MRSNGAHPLHQTQADPPTGRACSRSAWSPLARNDLVILILIALRCEFGARRAPRQLVHCITGAIRFFRPSFIVFSLFRSPNRSCSASTSITTARCAGVDRLHAKGYTPTCGGPYGREVTRLPTREPRPRCSSSPARQHRRDPMLSSVLGKSNEDGHWISGIPFVWRAVETLGVSSYRFSHDRIQEACLFAHTGNWFALRAHLRVGSCRAHNPSVKRKRPFRHRQSPQPARRLITLTRRA